MHSNIGKEIRAGNSQAVGLSTQYQQLLLGCYIDKKERKDPAKKRRCGMWIRDGSRERHVNS
ncbi:uncharacterized protein BDV17DRAFT_255173 [Aspergillus undulatus]|uniref:uncharacterized protein n=1 Tax=Aspergillus undulatus TaxID=1810928 RepID=UPI003CCE396D